MPNYSGKLAKGQVVPNVNKGGGTVVESQSSRNPFNCTANTMSSLEFDWKTLIYVLQLTKRIPTTPGIGCLVLFGNFKDTMFRLITFNLFGLC